jgi:hypothetical protein
MMHVQTPLFVCAESYLNGAKLRGVGTVFAPKPKGLQDSARGFNRETFNETVRPHKGVSSPGSIPHIIARQNEFRVRLIFGGENGVHEY